MAIAISLHCNIFPCLDLQRLAHTISVPRERININVLERAFITALHRVLAW
jgi:hypothetical protein